MGSNHCCGLGLSPQDKEDNKEKESLLVLSTLMTVVSIPLQKIMKKKKQNQPNWEHQHAGICRDLNAFLKGRWEEFHMMYEY